MKSLGPDCAWDLWMTPPVARPSVWLNFNYWYIFAANSQILEFELKFQFIFLFRNAFPDRASTEFTWESRVPCRIHVWNIQCAWTLHSWLQVWKSLKNQNMFCSQFRISISHYDAQFSVFAQMLLTHYIRFMLSYLVGSFYRDHIMVSQVDWVDD